MNNNESGLDVMKFVHELETKRLRTELQSLHSDALQAEIEAVYMMHLLKDALRWAKHTHHDGLTRRIATFLEFKGAINGEGDAEAENKEQVG